ncbi:MAG: DUF4157 domain-containing protein [Verrucomicrobiae bacterium]|nr:DUF4157 domain-containing protein [Verrucomicrobiae bacterium]
MRTYRFVQRHYRVRPPKTVHHARGEDHRTALQEVLGHPVRTKLKVGAPDDAREREADAVAERVMADEEQPLQRKCAACQEEDQEEVHRKPEDDEDRKKNRKEPPEEEVQTKAAGGGRESASVATDVASRIQARRGGGRPLSAAERAFYEPRFGTDFSQVHVHADSESATLAQRLAARAFTVGNDVFLGPGEYRPATRSGRQLLAHELTHVLQQAESGVVRRWSIGAAPAPAGFALLTDPQHRRRVDQAEGIVRGLLNSRNCRNYFRDHCTDGSGANALRNAFDNARVYLLPHDDNVFGSSINGTHDIAVNLRRIRIGRYAIAHTLTHEMFHTCDPVIDPNDEIAAENANEVCRLYAPWITAVSPGRGGTGTRVTITGIGFGGGQGPADSVRIGGINARVVSWAFTGTAGSSAVRIVVEVPAGAGRGGVVVINNNVPSSAAPFTVT